MAAKAGRYFLEKLADAGVDTVAPDAAITNASNVGSSFVQAEVNAIVTKLNAALAALRTHGIILP